MKLKEFGDLAGHTLKSITVLDGHAEMVFELEDGTFCHLYHDQDCCEYVSIEDVCGDLNDLIGHPILLAEEVIHDNENPDGLPVSEYQESFTWTFYKLATVWGAVTIRWYGESNGYYSERVSFAMLDEAEGW